MVRWFKFFRWPNLLIVAATMLMVRFLVVAPHLAEPGIFGIGNLAFGCLVAATVLVAAGGYIVNDIVDQEIDAANKPERVVVGRLLPESAAWKLYAGINGLALLCMAGLVGFAEFAAWMIVIPLAGGLLFGYAVRLKCSPIIGNLTVATLSAVVPLVVLASESESLMIPAGSRAMQLGSAYALFAFAASMFREAVKDLEDTAGDSRAGCRTLAVRNPALARLVGFVAMGGLALGVFLFLDSRQVGLVTWTVGVAFVLLPAVAANLLLILARSRQDFGRLSLVEKVIMLGGLTLLPVIPA